MKYLSKLFHERAIFYALLFIVGLGYSTHIKAQDESSFYTLQSVTAESDKKSTSISLKFDSKISMNKLDPEFHGTFINRIPTTVTTAITIVVVSSNGVTSSELESLHPLSSSNSYYSS